MMKNRKKIKSVITMIIVAMLIMSSVSVVFAVGERSEQADRFVYKNCK